MKLKVCGLREPENIEEVCQVSPDLIGFIFYPKSPRNVDEKPKIEIPKKVDRVGVFVNAEVEEIQARDDVFDFDLIQLHGNESPEMCRLLKGQGFELMKAFSIYDRFEFDVLAHYAPYVRYFLFDARGEAPGGNGVRFDWTVLKKYDLDTPYFLSGGIGPEEAERVNERYARDDRMIGVDVNSRFEVEPAVKNVEELKRFKSQLTVERTLRIVKS